MRNRGVVKFGRVGAVTVLAGVVVAVAGQSALPPAPQPAENPPQDAKRVLGKMLFFEQQLSADSSMACATCHVMSHGGTDPRRSRNPGKNGEFGDGGDVFGSPGIVARTADGQFDDTSLFGVDHQVTGRTTPSPFTSDYADAILWDGRAGDRFVDPVTKEVVIEAGGALETQALLPLFNTAEMGHAGRTLDEILAKLESVEPLALADRLPPDIASALADNPDYPALFERAFGDPAVTGTRIAMALATFERTLTPDQTDYDRFLAGDETALSDQEKRGLQAMTDAKCVECHTPPLFTDNSFRATGVRPPVDDLARGAITTEAEDEGRFRVPTLRNVALKSSFFHDGRRTDLHDAIKFYNRSGSLGTTPPIFTIDGTAGQVKDPSNPAGTFVPVTNEPTAGYGDGTSQPDPDDVQFLTNQDPIMPTIHMTPQQMEDIEAFLQGGLVDPRVQDQTFPFDRPLLTSEDADLAPQVVDTGTVGGTGVPEIVVTTPAFSGNDDFRIGVAGGPGDGTAQLVTWQDGGSPTVSTPVALDPSDVVGGNATVVKDLTGVEPGTVLNFAWQVEDPNAPNGVALSPTVEVPVFATRAKSGLKAGMRRAPRAPASVDDTNAYVARASFRIDRKAHRKGVDQDEFYALARINPRGLGTDLSQGRLTVKLGGVSLLSAAALDAEGRIDGEHATVSFDTETGNLLVSLSGLDLTAVFARARTGARGKTDTDVEISLQGLGIENPTVTADVPFAWKAKGDGASASGSYDFKRSGAEAGAFQVTRVRTSGLADGLVRVTLVGVIDAPGNEEFTAPNGLVIRIGSTFRLDVAADSIGVSKKNHTLAAGGSGDLRSLRIDTRSKTISLDVVVDDPSLANVPLGSVVPLRVRIETNPGAGAASDAYETVVDIPLH